MMNPDELVNDMVEIELIEEDDFLKVKETLQRIGISSKKDNTLYQSCHILHKKGRYYIVHFKELFLLDGKQSTMTKQDFARRNAIAELLEEWGLVNIVDQDKVTDTLPVKKIKILPYKEKKNWNLVQKYNLGNG